MSEPADRGQSGGGTEPGDAADSAARLARLRRQNDLMVSAVGALVAAESPSSDRDLLERCAAVVSSVGADATGAPGQIVRVDGQPHLEWRFGARTRVALIGHFDTVWPAGTLASRPFAVVGDQMTGPGCFDMKAGIVQLFAALSTLESLDGVSILLTSDEELGSQTSRRLVQDVARHARAALLLEPAGDGGALKTSRKGTGMYTLEVSGRAAHAGLEPEKGANALVAAAHLVLALEAIARPEIGTTVTPTMASAGSVSNVVPASATVEVDVRVLDPAEAGRVDADIRALSTATSVDGTTLVVRGGPNRPPMPASASSALFAHASSCARCAWASRHWKAWPWVADRTATSPPRWAPRPSMGSVPWAAARTPSMNTP